MQVIVTSYCRLKYLKKCIESLRQDEGVHVFIADGGSDEETRQYISENSDGCLFFEDNPGADHLKTKGIKAFATDPEFMITSDDLEFPKGYSKLIYEQYLKLNERGLEWSFMACNMPAIDTNPAIKWLNVNGVDILPVDTSQVAGAIIDRDLCQSVGYFPVYGRSGQGDWAFSKRLREKGIKVGYFRKPIIQHLGAYKWQDYPEYSKKFKEDEDAWIQQAQQDALRGKV